MVVFSLSRRIIEIPVPVTIMSYDRNKNRLIIDYRRLGTVSEKVLSRGLLDDIRMIEQEFGVRFYTGAKLFVWASDEYGAPRSFKHSGGASRVLASKVLSSFLSIMKEMTIRCVLPHNTLQRGFLSVPTPAIRSRSPSQARPI